jgi:hypothetical protein
MAIDRFGKTITEGCRVFNNYYREYGIITNIPNNGDFDFVKVKYLKREEFDSPLELEISIIQQKKKLKSLKTT